MARNTYTLDGIPLTDPDGRWFLEKSSGLRTIPAKRMANISYPGVDGDAFIPGATFTPGGVSITMYVEGADHQEFMERVEFLNGLFLQRHKLLELRHDYDVDGLESRHAFVKFSSSGEISFFGQGMKQGTINYMAEIPGVFWRSYMELTQSVNVSTTPVTSIITVLAGGNAPVADSLIRVQGGFSKLTLQDETTGSTLTFNSALAANEYIIVDCKNWTARKVTTDTWDGGVNVDMSVVSNRGYGSMFTMEPSIFGAEMTYRVTAWADNPASPRFEIRAKKSYL